MYVPNVMDFVRPSVRASVRRAGRPTDVRKQDFGRSKNRIVFLEFFERCDPEAARSVLDDGVALNQQCQIGP